MESWTQGVNQQFYSHLLDEGYNICWYAMQHALRHYSHAYLQNEVFHKFDYSTAVDFQTFTLLTNMS